MKILAFDSTASVASVAVCEDEKLLALFNIDNGLTQSELLLPMAEDALKALKLSFSDIELFCCSTGPGSFTGVRIGASLVKGLAFGRDIPCLGISTLEALAQNLFPLKGYILPCMDARRAQVYNAVFYSDGVTLKRITEDRAISLLELCSEARTLEGDVYLCGDGYSVTKAAFEKADVAFKETPSILITQNAYSVAKAAYRRFLSGERQSDLELCATYLRMPQAERERLERLNKKD